MGTNEKGSSNENPIVEICEYIPKHTHFTVESANVKPIDVSLMTGNSSNQNNSENKGE